MRRNAAIKLYKSITDVKDEYIEEAMEGSGREISGGSFSLAKGSKKVLRHPAWVTAAAAVLVLCIIAVGIITLTPSKDMVIAAYAYEGDQEITAAGATFTTGKLDDLGNLSGHPLMFHLSCEKIASIRFSCKNGQMNFIDLTEQRDEYGFAGNFTVDYGERESDYSFLLIDWVPEWLVDLLGSGECASVREIPKELRQDIIVMEIKGSDGRSATKAITITLNDDGTFSVFFKDYRITDADDFVNRLDAAPISRHIFYERGDITVTFYDRDGNEILPDAGWYLTNNLDHIEVRWMGRFADMVQMFFTPSGTETIYQMELLGTQVKNNAENVVIFPGDLLQRESLMGHLDFLIDFGSGISIRSDPYEVFYDEDYYEYVP